ncbi:hypothetical protein ZOD2009_11990 [Haladaptatus paucihalophilus DX253]|uniref:Uncharacterized protein n=1 Tax=Haladaptatus paucihalophilus DX253 TaxID=797209 RepID=E7QUB8_HALPU|nr:hypothetical protein ZOD2009_11990 [Haladaptatus paucihalophilus DX253]
MGGPNRGGALRLRFDARQRHRTVETVISRDAVRNRSLSGHPFGEQGITMLETTY